MECRSFREFVAPFVTSNKVASSSKPGALAQPLEDVGRHFRQVESQALLGKSTDTNTALRELQSRLAGAMDALIYSDSVYDGGLSRRGSSKAAGTPEQSATARLRARAANRHGAKHRLDYRDVRGRRASESWNNSLLSESYRQKKRFEFARGVGLSGRRVRRQVQRLRRRRIPQADQRRGHLHSLYPVS